MARGGDHRVLDAAAQCEWCGARYATGLDEACDLECDPCAQTHAGRELGPAELWARLDPLARVLGLAPSAAELARQRRWSRERLHDAVATHGALAVWSGRESLESKAARAAAARRTSRGRASDRV